MSNNASLKYHDPRSIPGIIGASSAPPFVIGLALAVVSGVFIGVSFILKKKALDGQGEDLAAAAAARLQQRAADGGLAHLNDFKWWIGLGILAIGEETNRGDI
jgi:hypothetical protein